MPEVHHHFSFFHSSVFSFIGLFPSFSLSLCLHVVCLRLHASAHMWSWKQVKESVQALFWGRGEHVTTGLNTSVVLHTPWGPCFPSDLCLVKGPPSTYSWDAGWSNSLPGEVCTCTVLPKRIFCKVTSSVVWIPSPPIVRSLFLRLGETETLMFINGSF